MHRSNFAQQDGGHEDDNVDYVVYTPHKIRLDICTATNKHTYALSVKLLLLNYKSLLPV